MVRNKQMIYHHCLSTLF